MNELVITNYKNSIISAVYEDKKMIQVSACSLIIPNALQERK